MSTKARLRYGAKLLALAATLAWLTVGVTTGVAQDDVRGKYFSKKSYTPQPLPVFQSVKSLLPAPIYDEKPLWVATYWKAWELAFQNFYEPAPQSGFVSQFIDAAFNANIFGWDTCFMSMFCKYGHPLVPAVGSLDNFYARQHEDGEICREIRRSDGADYVEWVNDKGEGLFSRWGWNLSGRDARKISRPVVYIGRATPQPNPKLTLDGLNHPILAWAELDSYQLTGDRDRLARVWDPLYRYYAALQKYLLQGNGLYITDWASMDNSPRNIYLIDGGTGLDISAEMVMFARQMAEIGSILGKKDQAQRFSREADALAALINSKMWDPETRFYYDLTKSGERAPVKTIAAYWTLLAKVASDEQAQALMEELKNPHTFGRLHRVPTLSADAPGYVGEGGYWRGAVWVPTDTMVIRGLEQYGNRPLAREIALEHLRAVADVFADTGTIWENYAPDAKAPGKPARRDFVGWSGLGPIMYFLEYAIGLSSDAPRNELEWRLESKSRTGCERYRFNGRVVTLIAEPSRGGARKILIESDGPFRLRIAAKGTEQVFQVRKGRQYLTLA
jgi:glycogen debranching enzyme